MNSNKKTIKGKRKEKIPQAVWNKYCGEGIGEIICFGGCGGKITPFTFECGHVIAEAEGG